MKAQTIQKLRSVMIQFVIVMSLVNGFMWLHWRFGNSQNWRLPPGDYRARVIPVNNPLPEQQAEQFRKTNDGLYYVQVIMDRVPCWFAPNLLGPFILALPIFILDLRLRAKQRASEAKPQEQSNQG